MMRRNFPDNTQQHPSVSAMSTVTLTWRDMRQSLPTASESVLEEIKKLTAPSRAAARTEAAASAALAWVDANIHHPSAPSRTILAAGICAAETQGIYGGGHSCPGAATLRHPAFRSLGSGRRQAGDGGAWTAAICHAADEVLRDGWGLPCPTQVAWRDDGPMGEERPPYFWCARHNEEVGAVHLTEFVRCGALEPEAARTLLRRLWQGRSDASAARAAAYAATLTAIEAVEAEQAAEAAAAEAAIEAAKLQVDQ